MSPKFMKLKEKQGPDKLSKEYKSETKRIAFKISITYQVIGVLWIVLSDLVVDFFLHDSDVMTFINLIKGGGYVVATGMFVYYLVYTELKRTKYVEDELIESNKNLTQANMELEATYGQLSASEDTLRQQYEQLIENQQKLKESEERYRLISDATNDAVWEEKNFKRSFSDRWYEVTGYSKEELEEVNDWQKLIHPEDRANVNMSIEQHILNKTPYYECQYRLKISDGSYKWVQARGKALFDENGYSYYKAGAIRDITEIKDYEQQLKFLAYHDQLTGLKNRISMKEYFNTLVSEKCENISLLHIDIDNFKYINDTLGHSFGDLLLINISRRLSRYESDNCKLYRLGGDEYIVLFKSYKDLLEVEKLGVKILKEFNNSFEIEKINLFIKISMGITLYPEHGKCIDEMLKNADIALHKAKELGKNRIIIYNQPMNEAITERVIIEKRLRTALNNNEFELYYQPQFSIKDNRISGFEALIRWRNSELGFVSPARFIGVAEATHLIIPIGEWVLKNACIFLKRIHSLGFKDMTMSINVSILQLLQDDFADMVMETLDLIGVDPKYLEIEITETILMESYDVIYCKLKRLNATGIRIALDDFGKGYSSLNYLRQLPISTLKIDKSFIDTISSDRKNKSIIDLIVKIGKSMDLCVVAEGVETKDQVEYLVKHKCNKIQGYFFCKPLPEQEVLKVIHNINIDIDRIDKHISIAQSETDEALTSENMSMNGTVRKVEKTKNSVDLVS